MMIRRFALLALCMTIPLLSGCGSNYVIRGKAVRGDFSTVSFVSVDDSRLQNEGVINVEIYLFRDPDRGDREVAARVNTNDVGEFVMPVNKYGAGWMIEQWLIHTYRPGYQSAQSIVSLPKPKQNLVMLVTLGRGVAEMPRMPDDVWRQYEHFK